MTKDYEINEKDIDTVIRYLQIYDPNNATPENAITILEELKDGVSKIYQNNPDLLEQLQKELKAKND